MPFGWFCSEAAGNFKLGSFCSKASISLADLLLAERATDRTSRFNWNIILHNLIPRNSIGNERSFVLLLWASCGSKGGGARGPYPPPPVPVKTSHQNDGRHPLCLIFHVSCPPPPPSDHPGSDAVSLLFSNIIYIAICSWSIKKVNSKYKVFNLTWLLSCRTASNNFQSSVVRTRSWSISSTKWEGWLPSSEMSIQKYNKCKKYLVYYFIRVDNLQYCVEFQERKKCFPDWRQTILTSFEKLWPHLFLFCYFNCMNFSAVFSFLKLPKCSYAGYYNAFYLPNLNIRFNTPAVIETVIQMELTRVPKPIYIFRQFCLLWFDFFLFPFQQLRVPLYFCYYTA